jgi:hypothetical protein
VLLADSSLLATFLLERGTAADQAALAAHCALSIKERWPESSVVLTTGLSLRDKSLPVGEVMDRAGDFLRRFETARSPSPQVMLDETTAGLLGPRFQLEKVQSGVFLLLSERLGVDGSRPLLGRPTPCVGREQELALMEVAFNACLEDSAARALLITAAPGTGKSRLRHEFLRRLERREQPMLVLLGRADPMSAGSAYGLVGQALRQLCNVVEGEPLEARREKLTRRVSRYLMPSEMRDTVAFLGELCGVPFSPEDIPRLRAAREDAREMSARVAAALVAFLRAELSQGPVLLVLEDLHWSDSSTVRLVEDVLSELAESPLLVLALARPEVKELFPGLWARHVQELVLRSLSQKASARLVHEVLGAEVSEAMVARLVEQSAGNALFLEELIRGVAEGQGAQTPGTVLAMLQSRLQRLEPLLRRVLLAGSIFGRTFWALEPSGQALEGIQSLQGAVALWMEDFAQLHGEGEPAAHRAGPCGARQGVAGPGPPHRSPGARDAGLRAAPRVRLLPAAGAHGAVRHVAGTGAPHVLQGPYGVTGRTCRYSVGVSGRASLRPTRSHSVPVASTAAASVPLLIW